MPAADLEALAKRRGLRLRDLAPEEIEALRQGEGKASKDDASRLLVPVDLGNVLNATIQPPAFVVESIIPRGAVTLLGGHGGAGKSILGLTIAAHVAAGAPTWANLRLQDGRALFASLEDPGELIRYRLRHIAEVCDLDAAKIGRRLHVLDGTETAASLASEFNDNGMRRLGSGVALEELAEAAKGCALIVVDNASDAYDGPENDRRMVRGFLRMLTSVARDTDAGLILLAHIDKAAARNGSAGNSYSGSTAWHNSARSRLALVEEDGRIELRHEKSNLGRKVEPIALEWSPGGVLVPASAAPLQRGGSDAGDILAALQTAELAGVDIGAARTGPHNAQTVLGTFAELPDRLKGPRGRKAFWAGLGTLQSAGKVRTVEIRTAARNTKKVLQLVAPREFVGSESAALVPPHPLAPTTARGGAGISGGSRELEPTQTHAPCPACDGEGCAHCRRAA